MKNYKVCLPLGIRVGTVFTSFDHWVTVKANNEWEAKSKAISKIAYQMRYGDKNLKNCEMYFFFNKTPLRSIKADIDIGDLKLGE